jgi:hypothetical protein
MGKNDKNEIVDLTGVENTEGVTVPGVTVPTAAPITYGAGIENLGYDDWAAINVKDTTADYKNAQAALDLNYRTEMATYGENAERMYQMGLSGSGVSDIYGANAYSAYLAASNDLKLRQIEEQKANRQSWEKYRRDQEEKSRLQHAQVFSSLADQYSEDASGVSNENALRTSMAAQGMSQAEGDAVMNDIKSYWAGNESVRDANHKTVIDAGYATAYGLFDGNNAEEVKQALVANGLSEADAAEVMKKFKGADTSTLPAVKAKEERLGRAQSYIMQNYNGKNLEQLYANLLNDGSGITQADVNSLRDWFKGQNDTDSWGGMVKAKEEQDAADQNAANKIYNDYKDSFVWSGVEAAEGAGEEKAVADLRAELKRQNYSDAAIEIAIENLKNNFTANYNAATIAQNLMSDPEYNYTGKASDKGELKRSIKALGYSDAQADEIMGEMDKIYQSRKAETVNDITAKPLKESSFKELDNIRDGESDEELTTKANELLDQALEDDSGLLNAYNLVGVDETTWSEMSPGDRLLNVLDRAGYYAQKGLISQDKKNEYFAEWIIKEIQTVSAITSMSERTVASDELMQLISGFVDKGYIDDPGDESGNIGKIIAEKLKALSLRQSDKVTSKNSSNIPKEFQDSVNRYKNAGKNKDNIVVKGSLQDKFGK